MMHKTVWPAFYLRNQHVKQLTSIQAGNINETIKNKIYVYIVVLLVSKLISMLNSIIKIINYMNDSDKALNSKLWMFSVWTNGLEPQRKAFSDFYSSWLMWWNKAIQTDMNVMEMNVIAWRFCHLKKPDTCVCMGYDCVTQLFITSNSATEADYTKRKWSFLLDLALWSLQLV